MAQLRLSCHKLNIETGRYVPYKDRLSPELRLCKLCNMNVCEDEKHFILICPHYAEERKLFLDHINIVYPYTTSLSSDQLFIWLMANLENNIIKMFSKYLHSIYSIRIFGKKKV